MNGNERICRALRRETAGAVPTFEWFLDTAVGRALTGSDDPLDVVERLDLDGVNVRPDFRKAFQDEATWIDEWQIHRQRTGDCLPALLDSPIRDVRRQHRYPELC